MPAAPAAPAANAAPPHAPPRPIADVARARGLHDHELEPYGLWKTKVRLGAAMRLAREGTPEGALVLVTSINPTKHGEGKTTVTIALAQGLQRLGHDAVCALREPSLGPVFGIKGGATGGGASSLTPAEDINLHFTGDLHAVTSANNVLATLVDSHIHFGNALGLDPTRITWPRCLDMNDRALRNVVVGLGGPTHGPPRESGFVITAASEVMAVLCLASDIEDLKRRLGDILVGARRDGGAARARDLRAQGAMAVLLKDAVQPNLVQTVEGVPAVVHGGPFANIAHGTSSVLGTRLALRLGRFVVQEAGFGADLGAEKFLHIFRPALGVAPRCAVVVVTVRALKAHGGGAARGSRDAADRGAAASGGDGGEDVEAVRRGLPHLDHHLGIVRAFGLRPVVALNRFAGDGEAELRAVLDHCAAGGVAAAEVDGFARGGEGAEALARHVVAAVASARDGEVRPLVPPDAPLLEKLHAIATRVYGADGVDLDYAAEKSLERLRDLGLDRLPVCVAKTQYSLSDQPRLLGVPRGWRLTVRDLRPSAGAGFVVALAGDVVLMPGLGRSPAAEGMDLLPGGSVRGVT